MYLHPRDEKGALRFEPAGNPVPSRFEQFRRFCLHRGVSDPRTVAARYRAKYGTRPEDGAGDAGPGAGQSA